MTHSNKNTLRRLRYAAIAACLTTLVAGSALAGEPIAFPDNDDIADSPGVFTGNDGGFVVTVWRDGRRTFGSEQPAPYGLLQDPRYGQPPAGATAAPRQAYYRMPSGQPAYKPEPPKRRGVVADVATPE